MSNCKYLVAIGASAGGLDPCERFFDGAPTDQGFAYVVIQHLSPDFRSLMDELLARHSTMPIFRVEDGMEIEPNTIYLNRPRQILTVADGKFVISPDEGDDILRLPIDSFFESLALDFKERSIGVVLSGSGSDGAKGAREIKNSGGRVFVQSPQSAKFESMPMAIVNSDIADGVADPDKLPEMIEGHIAGRLEDASRKPKKSSGDPYTDILELLRERFGTNFQNYKPETTKRRLDRRLDLTGYRTLEKYYDALLEDMVEQEAIYADLLIEVTSFYRDIEAFEEIEKNVIPKICKMMSKDHQVRIWVPGCASGEEAYSLAILVAEHARENDQHFNLKILATDIHQRSLSAASAGIYSKEALSKMSRQRVERYFEDTGDYHQVKPSLRRSVVFSPHDLMADPPFTRMDLVSCRNVLIYLTEDAQRKVLTLFHFALRKDGVLFLGPSETTGKLSREFDSISQRWRIYKKRRNVRIFDTTRPLEAPRTMRLNEKWYTGRNEKDRLASQVSETDSIIAEALQSLLKVYAPSGFLVNQESELIHIFGEGRKFLSFSAGAFSKKLPELLPQEINIHASAMLERFRHGVIVENTRKVKITLDGREIDVRMGLKHLENNKGAPSGYAVFTIEEAENISLPVLTQKEGETSDDVLISSYAARVSELEHTLQVNEETLQSTIEEMETSNEELQATNEELMSANEELQSTNEELHSVNEELYTVSAEHQRKIEELTEITSDMDHLLKSTNIGTVFLDEQLHVRRFTPAASRTFNLIAQDIGRPINHITARFADVDVLEVVTTVRDTLEPVDKEVSADDRSYLMRVLPYVADSDAATGVVITMVDVNELKLAQRRISELTEFHSEILQDIGQIVFRWSRSDKKLAFYNSPFVDRFERTEEQLKGIQTTDLFDDPSWARVEEQLEDVRPGAFVPVRFRQMCHSGELRHYSGLIRAIKGRDNDVAFYQFTGGDVTPDLQYAGTLENVLEVDKLIFEDEENGDLAPTLVEEKRISALIELAKSYLNADTILVAIAPPQNGDDQPLFDLVKAEVEIPEDTMNVLEKLMPDSMQNSAPIPLYSTDETATDVMGLLTGLGAHRGVVGPIVSRDRAIGRAAFFVTDAESPDRRFTDLELSMVRIVVRWIGYIWERRRRMEDLRNSRNELQLIFNNVSSKIWYKDDQNRILRLNKAAADSMSITVEEGTGADTYDLFPEMAAKYHKDDLTVIDSGQPLLGILEEYTPIDGDRGWVRTDKVPYIDPVTGIRNLLVVASDVTTLMKREEELVTLNEQLEEERLLQQNLYLKTPAMMFSTDQESKINNVNLLLAKTGGYQREEMLNHSFYDFFEPYDPEEGAEFSLDTFDSEEGEHVLFKCKSGELIEVELASLREEVHPLADHHRLWFVQDVSARNEALKSLNDQNIELAKLNDGLAQFAYAASHDLQEPLRKISQYGDLLQEEHRDKLGEEGQYFVDVMTNSAQRMSGLIKSLLVFSSAAKGELEQSPIDLATLVGRSIEENRDLIEDSRAQVKLGSLPKVVCDADLVQIVLTNIITNALKYRAPRRRPVVEITAELDQQGKIPMQIITFSDNGLGFDHGDSERIFEPFARLVPKSKVQGSGIGLAICRTICERHGWRISASGSKSKGATFQIAIPMRQDN